MADSHRLHVITGDDVVTIDLRGPRVLAAETVLAGRGACCVAADPGDPALVYVGTFDDGVHASDDAGGTWRAAGDGLQDRRVLALAVAGRDEAGAPSTVFAGTEPSNLYRSDDRGAGWELLPALRGLPSEPRWSFPGRPWTHHVRTIAVDPHDPARMLVGIELGGVMRSTDGGASWAEHNPQAHSDAHQLLTHPLAPGRVYEAAGQGVCVSDDLGATWRRFEDGLDRRYGWAAAVDPADPELWYLAVSRSPAAAHGTGDGEGRVLRATRSGWVAADGWGDSPSLRRMPYSLATLPGRPGAVVAGLRGGTLLLSDDAGESWTELDVRLPDVVAMTATPA